VTELARLAERGLLDLVTLDDQHPTTPEPGRAHGALDATLALTAAAAQTVHIGLVPTGVVVGEPAVVAGRVETFDRITGGRGGWRPRVAVTDEQKRLAAADPAGQAAFTEERFAHATEFVGAVADFWDNWREESPADIGRVSRAGRWVDVSGYPRVPTSPAGPPLTAVLAHFTTPFRLAARHADIVFVTPFGRAGVLAIRAELTELCAELREVPAPLTVLADLDVVLADTPAAAARRRAALEDAAGGATDADTFTGTAAELAELMTDWHRDGGVDGFRIRPAALPEDLRRLVDDVVPILQERNVFKREYRAPLRTRVRGVPIR
jgi:alkanesulfonate monooxygenase SsuD/methylene tetrahydromethanopterin reductase-like flavin-dependent oxidoreductase (luciferase family)